MILDRDPYGTGRIYPTMDRGFDQPVMASPREDIEQAVAEAKAHHAIMKDMSLEKRIDYFKNYVKSLGEDRGLTLQQEAASFMNLVHRTPAKDPLAAAHGQSDRDQELGASDARLFFGRGLMQSILGE